MRSFTLALALLIPFGAAIAQPPPPPPLGPPPQPAGNRVTTAKANLGKTLFFDEQLSSTRTVACATCHQAEHGGGDRRAVIGTAGSTHPGVDGIFGTGDDVMASPGVPLNLNDGTYDWSASFGLQTQVTPRKSPSSINAAYFPLLFWDGRATPVFRDPLTSAVVLLNGAALESQAVGPPVSTTEMGHVGRDWNAVATQMIAAKPLALAPSIPATLDTWIANRSYPQLFAEAFGSSDVTPSRIAMAIATFERTLFSNQTPFDAEIAGIPSLTPQERAGRLLFNTINCGICHGGALFTDNAFHYIGVRPSTEDQGRFAITGNPGDMGAFRTPSLRNAQLRGPYFHDGRFATLEEVIEFYNRGGDFTAVNKAPAIRPLNLSAQQKADLVAFLKRPLTDPRVAAATTPFDAPALYSQSTRVPQILGTGTAGAGGLVPQPEAIEPPIAGNQSFTVGVYGALGGATATLVIDTTDPGTGPTVPGAASFALTTVQLSGVGSGNGFASVSLAIADGPGLVGAGFFGRWFVSDPSAEGGVAVTPAFHFTVFGPAGTTTDVAVPPRLPLAVAQLHANTPNPFNPETTIRYELRAGSPVQLGIYDAAGHRVRRLIDASFQPAGSYDARWNGRDEAGTAVASGVYLYRLQAGSYSETRRAVLLK